MLLNIKLSIEITNDGKENTSKVTVENPNYKWIEVATAISMAQSNIEDMIYLVDLKEFTEETVKNITMREIYEKH